MSDTLKPKAWQAVADSQADLQSFSLQQAFCTDPSRAQRFSASACNIFLDYSKQRISDKALQSLLALADASQLTTAIQSLFDGDTVNTTESRPALHWLLRAQPQDTEQDDLQEYIHQTTSLNGHIRDVATQIMNGQLRGYTGKPFTDIVNIGIGGSDLGPAMVYQALAQHQQEGLRCHFVSNICAHDLLETLQSLNPHTTLFIASSKSFTTLETLTNANSARQWLLDALIDEEAIASHFFAVSSKPELAQQWGIKADYVFPFCDWVGGRYSLWSSIGLSLCIGLGFDTFQRLLNGAREMDLHFRQADFPENLPVLMALIGIWNTNFWQWPQQAVIPYDHRLRRFPAFLQQLEMESNGKHCNLQGELIDYTTCPTVWGEAGTNGQHSFFQLLHQGSHVIPVDFVAVVDGGHSLQQHQDWLFSNCLAQSRALMTGQSTDHSLPEWQHMPGNKPSSTLLLPALTPETLGAVIALYEHKVYAQSVIWNINAFDQWGVELGKKISVKLKKSMETGDATAFDTSTQQLLARYQQKT